MSILASVILGLPNWVAISLALLASISLLFGGFIATLLLVSRTQDGFSTYLQGNIDRTQVYAYGERETTKADICDLPDVA